MMPEASSTSDPSIAVEVPRFYTPGTQERRAYTLALQDIVSHLCTITNTQLSHSHSDSDLLRENRATERTPLLLIRTTPYGGVPASVQAGTGDDPEAGGTSDSHRTPHTLLKPKMQDNTHEPTYNVQILLSLYATLVSLLQLSHTSSYSPLGEHPILIILSLGLVFITVIASALVVAFCMHQGGETCRWWARNIRIGTYISSLLAALLITAVLVCTTYQHYSTYSLHYIT